MTSLRSACAHPIGPEPTSGDPLSRDAFTSLVRRHDHAMRGLAYRLLGGDRHRMDDVLQDAYLNAFRARAGFKLAADFRTWLYRIVYNACIDELRRGARRPPPVDTRERSWDRPITRSGPEKIAVATDVTLRALRALPVQQRVTLVLVDGEGFDNATAASILGVSPGTVGSRLSRARASVRRMIEEEGQ
jgi:RNA polymerase sigma-70 factor (ECF subfamily)